MDRPYGCTCMDRRDVGVVLAATASLRRLESRVGIVGPVAQGLEQSAHNRSVGGSIPSGPTTG